MKQTDIYTTDQDQQLNELFGQLREEVISDDGFSDKVMHYIPRRDISMWVISFALLCGIMVAVLALGADNSVMAMGYLREFAVSIVSFEIPSRESLVVVIGALAVLAMVIYAILDTDDYCENNFI